MNPDDILSQVISIANMSNGGAGSLYTTIGNGGAGTLTGAAPLKPMDTIVEVAESILDQWSMNRITVDHKLQEQELMKLREAIPTYADEIKRKLGTQMTDEVSKRVTYTKKHDKDADVHHFLGRVWVFTEDELKQLIKDARRA